MSPNSIPKSQRERVPTACLAALCLDAAAYQGGTTHSGREYGGSRYLGPVDGRYAWRFGHEIDAEDFARAVPRVAERYGLDGDASDVQPHRDGTTEVRVRLEPIAEEESLVVTPRELVYLLAEMLLVRRGAVLDEATADERARNIAAALAGYTVSR